MRGPLDGVPAEVTIYEVGPRDGLQNESVVLPAAVKADFITRLADAGLRVIEAASFVHPPLGATDGRCWGSPSGTAPGDRRPLPSAGAKRART